MLSISMSNASGSETKVLVEVNKIPHGYDGSHLEESRKKSRHEKICTGNGYRVNGLRVIFFREMPTKSFIVNSRVFLLRHYGFSIIRPEVSQIISLSNDNIDTGLTGVSVVFKTKHDINAKMNYF